MGPKYQERIRQASPTIQLFSASVPELQWLGQSEVDVLVECIERVLFSPPSPVSSMWTDAKERNTAQTPAKAL